eukprot:5537478-Pleurochrysis_carterae.AAC.1
MMDTESASERGIAGSSLGSSPRSRRSHRTRARRCRRRPLSVLREFPFEGPSKVKKSHQKRRV